MFDYTVQKVDDCYVVLACGQPQLTFDSLASAEAAIAAVAALALLPPIVWPESVDEPAIAIAG